MIYITGDCHGNYCKFNTNVFPEQKYMTKDDYVIICGDFGFWDNSKEQNYWRNWLEKKPFTTLWVDGNHENYDLLSTIETDIWNGGKVQFINPSVIHLMRGQVYEIEGFRIFTFGGARSHDISGGILDKTEPDYRRKKRQLDRQKKSYRVNHVSWWKEEMPCEEDFDEGRRNMEKHNWNIDYIITHCCSSGTQEMIGKGMYPSDKLTDYLQEIKRNCNYKQWFFGHYHNDRMISPKEILLYERIIRIV